MNYFTVLKSFVLGGLFCCNLFMISSYLLFLWSIVFNVIKPRFKYHICLFKL